MNPKSQIFGEDIASGLYLGASSLTVLVQMLSQYEMQPQQEPRR
jgi:hexokinase